MIVGVLQRGRVRVSIRSQVTDHFSCFKPCILSRVNTKHHAIAILFALRAAVLGAGKQVLGTEEGEVAHIH